MILGLWSALLGGCAPQLPVRTVPNAVRVMIAQTPSGELDPWLSRVVEAAERGELTLDDVERIERAVVEVFADGVVEPAEIHGLRARFDLPEAQASSFEMDRVPADTEEPLRTLKLRMADSWEEEVSCGVVGSETRCVVAHGDEVRLARVRQRRWERGREVTWEGVPGLGCERVLDGWWSTRIQGYRAFDTSLARPPEPTAGHFEGGMWHVDSATLSIDEGWIRTFCPKGLQ